MEDCIMGGAYRHSNHQAFTFSLSLQESASYLNCVNKLKIGKLTNPIKEEKKKDKHTSLHNNIQYMTQINHWILI